MASRVYELRLSEDERVAMLISQRTTKEHGHFGPWRLTAGQVRVLDLMIDGADATKAAKVLGLSRKTVHAQFTRIFARMGVNNTARSLLLWDRWRRLEASQEGS
jgi:DNA-binding NarL/FixJ family response regulator